MTTTTTNQNIVQDTVANAVIAIRQKHEAAVKQHYADTVAEANAAYDAELDHKRKKFVREYMDENYVPPSNPYEGMDDEDIYRLSLPHEERLESLLKTKCWIAGVRCFVYRQGSTTNVDAIKHLLRPYGFQTEGDAVIKSNSRGDGTKYDIHAQGSREFVALMRECRFSVRFENVRWVTSYAEVERSVHAPSLPYGTHPDQREVLASDDPNYPAEQW